MSEFEVGDKVRLTKAGRKYMETAWGYLPEGEDKVGTVVSFVDRTTSEFLGCPRVAFGDTVDIFTEGTLKHANEFPKKVPAYEVRIGDVIKDFEDEKMRVHRVLEDDGGTEELRFGGYTVDGGTLTLIYRGATKKVKVFSREYR